MHTDNSQLIHLVFDGHSAYLLIEPWIQAIETSRPMKARASSSNGKKPNSSPQPIWHAFHKPEFQFSIGTSHCETLFQSPSTDHASNRYPFHALLLKDAFRSCCCCQYIRIFSKWNVGCFWIDRQARLFMESS